MFDNATQTWCMIYLSDFNSEDAQQFHVSRVEPVSGACRKMARGFILLTGDHTWL